MCRSYTRNLKKTIQLIFIFIIIGFSNEFFFTSMVKEKLFLWKFKNILKREKKTIFNSRELIKSHFFRLFWHETKLITKINKFLQYLFEKIVSIFSKIRKVKFKI